MWISSHEKRVPGISPATAWKIWSDVDHWSEWQKDTDEAKLLGPFRAGSFFFLKPKGGPRVRIEIIEAKENAGFTDLTRFPLAKMFGIHEFFEDSGELVLRTSIRIEGPLSWLWRKIVAQGVADSLPMQTDWLIEKAKEYEKRTIPA